jgi:hypothetical protein
VVEDLTAGRTLHREPVRAGDTFALSYVHSSEHVPVRGVFRIEDDGGFTPVETAFAGFGPGLPALAAGDRWTVRDGMIVARHDGTRLPDVTVRVQPITRHRLTTPGGTDLDLSARAGPGARLRIAAR